MATLKKTGKTWTIIIEREDSSCNDYRFDTKAEARKWAKLAGVNLK